MAEVFDLQTPASFWFYRANQFTSHFPPATSFVAKDCFHLMIKKGLFPFSADDFYDLYRLFIVVLMVSFSLHLLFPLDLIEAAGRLLASRLLATNPWWQRLDSATNCRGRDLIRPPVSPLPR